METLTLQNPYPELVSNPGINQLVYLPHPGVLVASDTALGVRAWKSGKILWEHSFASKNDKIRPTMRVRGIAASHQSLIAAVGDKIVALDAASGESLWTHTPPRSWGFLITSPLCVAADEQGLAAGFDNGTIGVWSPDGNSRLVRAFNDAPRWIAVDHSRLIGCDGFAVSVWDRVALRSVSRFKLSDRAYGFAFSPARNLVAILTLHAVELWDLAAAKLIKSIPTQIGRPTIAFMPTGDHLLIAEYDQIRWISLTGEADKTQPGFDTTPLSLALDPTGRAYYLGGADGRIHAGVIP